MPQIMVGDNGEWDERELTPDVQAQIESGQLVPCAQCDEHGEYDDGLPSYHPRKEARDAAPFGGGR